MASCRTTQISRSSTASVGFRFTHSRLQLLTQRIGTDRPSFHLIHSFETADRIVQQRDACTLSQVKVFMSSPFVFHLLTLPIRPLSRFHGPITAVRCQVIDASFICKSLAFPHHRLAELAVLTGNDYSSHMIDWMDAEAIINAKPTDKRINKTIVQQFTTNMRASVSSSTSSRYRPRRILVNMEQWAHFLRQFDRREGADALLEDRHPLFQALTAAHPPLRLAF